MSKLIEPKNTIGIIGGGQLGRMMAFSAKERGYQVGVLDPTPNCPTAQVADWHIQADYDDAKALLELAEKSDVLTYEFENVDAESIHQVQDRVAVPQGTDLLLVTQNRLKEKEFLKKSGIPVATYAKIETLEDLQAQSEFIGFPSVLKTIQGGYDGKGQFVLLNVSDIDSAAVLLEQGTCILEQWVSFEKEVSVMVARNNSGVTSVFPVSENIHENNILLKSIVPARIPEALQTKVQNTAETIANRMELVGVLGVELFITEQGEVFANELAPRPHNSGHYSIEACTTSQFDMHIRAICGYDLPSVELLRSAIMINVLGEHQKRALELNERKPSWHVHDYGKAEARIGRKMGHVTILTTDLNSTLVEVEETNIWNH